MALKDTADKDFQTDGDQDNAAQNGSLVGKACAEFLADHKSDDADHKGGGGDEECAYKRHQKAVFCNGEADG